MKIIITTLAILSMTVAAYATDLPSKKKSPTTPVPPVTSVTPSTPESVDSLTAAYGQDVAVGDFGSKTDDIYQLTYTHKLGSGFSVGGMTQTSQVPGSKLNQNIEAQAGYSLPVMYGITLSGKVGIGEKLTTNNFGYYALYGSADYKVMDKLTFNAISYRYRSAFDSAAYGYQSNQIGTGVTYDLAKNFSVSAKVYRNYDTSFNSSGDQFMLGVTAKF